MPDNTTREIYGLNLKLMHNIFSVTPSTKGINNHPTVGTTKKSDNTTKEKHNLLIL
jgi:hypothetical protein